MFLRGGLVLTVLLISASVVAQDRDTKVRNDRQRLSQDELWIYNDLGKGIETARLERKPILLIFRCIPCEACALFDEQVVRREPKIKALMDKFVCVRIPQGNAMNLARFQFDYDLSFTAFMMHPDYTIYGRFGTRSDHDDSEKDISLEGFAEALAAALELHKGYPANRESLAGKQPKPVKFKSPEEYPALAGKYKDKIDYENKTAQSCLHCHQIRDAERLLHRQKREPLPDVVLYPYPMPDTVGLSLDRLHKATVKAVVPGSSAALDGFKPGDEIVSLAGQPLLSIADVQWILHHASDGDSLDAVVARANGKVENLTLNLESGWRRASDISWRSTTWDLRRMGTGGLLLESLPDADRKTAGLEGSLALRVKHVGEYGEHAVAKQAGFRKGDVIVSFDGQTSPMTESVLLALALQKRMPGDTLNVVVLREGKRVEMKLRLQ